MKRILTQEQLTEITAILNEMPIKEFNRVKAIIEVFNNAEILNESQDESNTED